ncbi:hypothetical protein Tco_0491910 [Tanacetum coccineum]
MILGLLFRGFPSTTPPAAADVAISDPTPKDLTAGTPSVKVMAKAEAFNKRKAFTFGSALSHVSMCTRSTTAYSSGSTSRSSLFVQDTNDDESDDENSCIEIRCLFPSDLLLLSRLSRLEGTRARVLFPPLLKVIATKVFAPPLGLHLLLAYSIPYYFCFIDFRGKAIMSDATNVPSKGVGRSQAFIDSTPASRDPIGDAIDRDFFPFAPRPYYATYPEDGVVFGSYEVSLEEWYGPHYPTLNILIKEMFKDPSVCKTAVDQFLTPMEMVWIESLFNDRLFRKMSVLHCLIMSYRGELLAQYRGLLKSHGEYVAALNDKVTAFDAVFVKVKTKGKDRKKKIKSLSRSLDHATAKVTRLSSNLNQARNIEAKKDAEILRFRASPPEFASFFQGGFQGLVQKFLASDEFSRFQGELLSLAANVGFKRRLHMDKTQEQFDAALKKISHFVPGDQGRLIEATPLVATIGYPFMNKVANHATHPLFTIVDLEPDRLTRPEVVPLSKATCVSPPIPIESTVTLNDEWVCTMVDMPDDKMMDGVAGKSKACGFPLSQDAAISASVGTGYAATAAASSGV